MQLRISPKTGFLWVWSKQTILVAVGESGGNVGIIELHSDSLPLCCSQHTPTQDTLRLNCSSFFSSLFGVYSLRTHIRYTVETQ